MKKGDFFLIALIILSSASVFFMTANKETQGQKVVIIQVDGKEYKRIKYNESVQEDIKIDTKFGHNVVSIRNNKVSMIESNCRDKLCIKQGSISRPGEVIICLPNRLLVEIQSENNEIDTINH